jgi:hypothetical protein
MKTTKQIATITLIIFLGVIAYGLLRTGRSMTGSEITAGGDAFQSNHGAAIDQTSLNTARAFAQMPTSAEELPWAQEALRLGDREIINLGSLSVIAFEKSPRDSVKKRC